MKDQVVLLVSALCASVWAQNLPSYIKPCDFTKPDFNQCAVKHGNDAIPHLVKGDRHLGIPPLNPLKLPVIDVEQGNFKITLKNVQISGIEDIKATKIIFNRSTFDASFYIENLNILGTYNIDGKVLLLNLQGEGPANLTAVGGDYDIKANLQEYTKNGKTYLKFGKPSIEFTLKRAYFEFGNLLGGDERLGPEINQILNDNWKDVLQDVGSPIKETVSTIIESIVSKILDKVPADAVLPN